MNLMRQESQPTEPYQPGVYMLTGINGIGKSTIVGAITEKHPETVPLHASHELRSLFDGISREELELLTPEEKLSRMVLHFTAIFERSLNDNRAVIMDTHLLVPIRQNDSVTYEDIWSSEYKPYVSSMAMLSTKPESVRHWRLEDEQVTGRKRNTEVNAIAVDQEKNIVRFEELRHSGDIPVSSTIVENQNGHISHTQAVIEQVFRSASRI